MDLVLNRLRDSLKENGIIYAPFKYSDFEGERNGRFFNDFTERTSIELFEKNGFNVLKTWIQKIQDPNGMKNG